MAKLGRTLFTLFGKDGPTDDFAEFGSQTAGTPVKTKDVSLIQSLSAWVNGWKDAIVAANKAPFLEDMNGLFYVLSYMIAYLFQEGTPEWDGSTNYFIGSIVKKPSTSELYGSLVDNNLGNALPNRADDSNWQYLGVRLLAYRRPDLVWNSGTTVDAEAQTGTANQTQIMFPDGTLRTVTEDLGTAQKYRRFDITKTAEFTSGTESGGLRSGLARTDNTWYAIYAVKSQIDATKFVLVGDTTLPLQANVSTLNGRYTTNGWLYLGVVRAGLNLGLGGASDSDIVTFEQKAGRSRFLAFSTTIAGPTPLTLEGLVFLGQASATTGQSSNIVYTYSPGTGAAQIPDHLGFVTYAMTQRKNPVGVANFGNIRVLPQDYAGGVNQLQTMAGLFAGEFFAGTEINWPASRGIKVQRNAGGNWPESSIFEADLLGWEDPILRAGLNETI